MNNISMWLYFQDIIRTCSKVYRLGIYDLHAAITVKNVMG